MNPEEEPRLDADEMIPCSNRNQNFNSDFLSTNQNVKHVIGVIWYDPSIGKHKVENQHTLSHLRSIAEQLTTFTDERECLEYIDRSGETRQLLLILPGSLGKDLVPRVSDRQQIRSIYIFCRMITMHEDWAKKFPKVNGVFNQITELRHVLVADKQQLESQQVGQVIMEPPTNLSPCSLDSTQNSDIEISQNNNNHPKIDIDRNIACSDSVAPYTPQKQQIELFDIGLWPCVCVIVNNRNENFSHLHSEIRPIHYFNSLESFLQHLQNHPNDPHLIILSNPVSLGYINRLIHPRVRQLYIYCSNDRLAEYDAWRDRHPQLISVLQNFDSLIQLILWDLSACILAIGKSYAEEGRQDLAQKRYRYAYNLHRLTDKILRNEREMIEAHQQRIPNN